MADTEEQTPQDTPKETPQAVEKKTKKTKEAKQPAPDRGKLVTMFGVKMYVKG